MRLILLSLVFFPFAGNAIEPATILPPELPWQGRSEQLIVDPANPWITPSEQTGLTTTPTYDETVDWLRKLVAAAPELELVSIGTSEQDRDIWMVIAGTAKRGWSVKSNGKPSLLAHGGIHAGEIDGKDAGLMLLRDLTVGKQSNLLDDVNLLFIPILNVDGHERRGRFNRMNQRGPVETGWRTNARNLNLNRDFTKLETAGVQALVRVANDWQPDLYLDLHVTDGADYQYDITFGYTGQQGWSPNIAKWLNTVYRPAVSSALVEMGHIPGPLVFAVNGKDMSKGNLDWAASPRYSNGWGDARQLPTVLLENHSLKPYRQRVLGTYVFVLESLRALRTHHRALSKAVARDQQPVDQLVLGFKADPAQTPVMIDFLGVTSSEDRSNIAGGLITRWSGEKINQQVQLVKSDQAIATVRRPKTYFIPQAWSDITERLQRHGIKVEQLGRSMSLEVDAYHLPDAQLDAANTPFEGRARYKPGTPAVHRREIILRQGDWRVVTDQPLGKLAMLLLEPQSPDSLFQWGYFGEILQRTEYFELYAAEPLAQAMLKADPSLQAAFDQKLGEDETFAADPKARLMWFYERSPYFDQQYRWYPVTRSVD